MYIYMCVCKNQSTVHTQTRARTHVYTRRITHIHIWHIFGKTLHLWLELRCSKLGRVKLPKQVEHFGAALGSTRGRTWQDVSDPKSEKMGRWPPLPPPQGELGWLNPQSSSPEITNFMGHMSVPFLSVWISKTNSIPFCWADTLFNAHLFFCLLMCLFQLCETNSSKVYMIRFHGGDVASYRMLWVSLLCFPTI